MYQGLLEAQPGAFERVKAFGKVSLVCDGKHVVLFNFTSPLQAAQAYAASGGSGPVTGISNHCEDGGQVKQQFPASMAADALAYFGTSAPQESDTGLPSFPMFCPDSLDLIVWDGYVCLDWLTNITAINPGQYSAVDPPGIKNLAAYGTLSTWRDCGAPAA